MTQTTNAPITGPIVDNSTASARRTTRALLAAGIAAGPLFLGVGVIQGFAREGFGFTRNAISQLSLGDLGWIQVTGFLLTGVLTIAAAIGMRQALRDAPGGVWAPRLVGVFGASFLLAGVFTADPGAGFPAGTSEGPTASLSAHGAVHMLSGMVGYLAFCAASFVLVRLFVARRRRGWAIACRLLPVGVLAGFAGSSASVLAFTIGAGLGLLWLTALSARLLTDAPTAQP